MIFSHFHGSYQNLKSRDSEGLRESGNKQILDIIPHSKINISKSKVRKFDIVVKDPYK